jgi:hypothetical protein
MARAVQVLALLMRLLLVLATMVVTAVVALAQRTPDLAGLPDAPTNQEQNELSQKPDNTPLKATLEMLGRRSVFFPELAFDKGRLKARQKLELAVDETIAPSRFLGSAFTAGIGQARDSLHDYGQGWNGYGKRFGSSVASNASSRLFGTFLLPSMLHQDPRYFVRFYGSTAQRIGYAIGRVVRTRRDDGRETFNWSFVIGGLMAEGLATSYLPPSERTAPKTLDRFGVRIGFSALDNVVKEYWPTIFRSLRITKIVPAERSDPGTVTPPTPY